MSGDKNHLLELWKPPKKFSNNKDIMNELLDIIKSYPPGQSRINKGGFSIIKYTPNYIYVQFESMKNGFIDDVEFELDNNKKNVVQV